MGNGKTRVYVFRIIKRCEQLYVYAHHTYECYMTSVLDVKSRFLHMLHGFFSSFKWHAVRKIHITVHYTRMMQRNEMKKKWRTIQENTRSLVVFGARERGCVCVCGECDQFT